MLLGSTQTVYASVSLNCFYSDQNIIAKNSGRNIYSLLYDGFSASDFSDYRSNARTQWSNAGVSSSYVSRLYDSNIELYGGKESTLSQIDADIESYWALTINVVNSKTGTTTYQGKTISLYELNRVQVLCPTHLFTSPNGYKNMFTHELGHSLGWIGHSSDSDDVMYGTAGSSRNTLTTRDKDHLKQMY